MVIEIYEWTFKSRIVRNTTFEENWDHVFGHFQLKMAKNDYF